MDSPISGGFLVSSWSMHEPTVYMVAPCCFLYGHWFAVEAATCCGDQQLRQRVARTVQDVLITTQALDGSWTGHEASGRVVGAALGTLALTRCLAIPPQ